MLSEWLLVMSVFVVIIHGDNYQVLYVFIDPNKNRFEKTFSKFSKFYHVGTSCIVRIQIV